MERTVDANELHARLCRTVEVSEAERRHWARQLHDDTLQGLAALQIRLTTAIRRDDPDVGREAMKAAVAQIEREIEGLRNLITDLRPPALDELGFGAALSSLRAQIRSAYDVRVDTEVDLDFESGRRSTRLTPEIESTAYRVIQEALTNVGRHTDAERVVARVLERDGQLTIEVRDEGGGFSLGPENSRFGLGAMAEWLDMADGSLAVESAPGEGTTVRATLPASHRLED